MKNNLIILVIVFISFFAKAETIDMTKYGLPFTFSISANEPLKITQSGKFIYAKSGDGKHFNLSFYKEQVFASTEASATEIIKVKKAQFEKPVLGKDQFIKFIISEPTFFIGQYKDGFSGEVITKMMGYVFNGDEKYLVQFGNDFNFSETDCNEMANAFKSIKLTGGAGFADAAIDLEQCGLSADGELIKDMTCFNYRNLDIIFPLKSQLKKSDRVRVSISIYSKDGFFCENNSLIEITGQNLIDLQKDSKYAVVRIFEDKNNKILLPNSIYTDWKQQVSKDAISKTLDKVQTEKKLIVKVESFSGDNKTGIVFEKTINLIRCYESVFKKDKTCGNCEPKGNVTPNNLVKITSLNNVYSLKN